MSDNAATGRRGRRVAAMIIGTGLAAAAVGAAQSGDGNEWTAGVIEQTDDAYTWAGWEIGGTDGWEIG